MITKLIKEPEDSYKMKQLLAKERESNKKQSGIPITSGAN